MNAFVETAKKRRRCSRNKGHSIPHGQRCLVIKENMAKRNYCLECAATIFEKAKKDLAQLAGELQMDNDPEQGSTTPIGGK